MKFQNLAVPLRNSVGVILRNFTTQRVGKNLMNVEKIQIDEGKFLYLLISIYIHGESLFSRTILRGKYTNEHSNLYDSVKEEMESLGLCTKALGGGFMNLNPKARTIQIYGQCKTFGRANHHNTKEMLLESNEYQNYHISVQKY